MAFVLWIFSFFHCVAGFLGWIKFQKTGLVRISSWDDHVQDQLCSSSKGNQNIPRDLSDKDHMRMDAVSWDGPWKIHAENEQQLKIGNNKKKMCHLRGSNTGPSDLQSDALPAELKRRCYIHLRWKSSFSPIWASTHACIIASYPTCDGNQTVAERRIRFKIVRNSNFECESTTKAISFSEMLRSRFDLILKKNYLFSDFKINFREFRDLKMNNINEDVITKTSMHKIR